MADPRTARPVSGEIMAGALGDVRPGRSMSLEGDVHEADFEVIAAPASRLPSAPSVDRKSETGDGMDMLRGAEDTIASRTGGASPGGARFWLLGAVLVLGAFWVSGGHSIVASAMTPATSNTGSVLVITDVASRVDASGPKPLLFVDGQAGNSGATVAVMPALEIRVTGKDGRVTRYNLGTSGRTVAPGETFAFSSRLDMPKNGVETVSVSFAE